MQKSTTLYQTTEALVAEVTATVMIELIIKVTVGVVLIVAEAA